MDAARIVISAVDQASSVINNIKQNVQQMAESSKKAVSNFSGFIEKNRSTIEGIRNASTVASVALLGIVGASAKAAGSFEKYQTVLSTSLKSQQKAVEAMNMIKEVSSSTPFELNELTQSYITLVNRGFIPTRNEIIKLGDLAASQGKSFNQLTEAVLDAQTGEFERLKEFGVTASASGDKVAFTFKGVTTQVQKTDKEIQNYLLSLGELEGVQGQMNNISQTFEGKMSNLSDSIYNLGVSIGSQLLPSLKPMLDSMILAINSTTQRITANPQLASTILVTVTAITSAVAGITAFGLMIPGLIALSITFGFLWTTMLGPVGIIIAAVGALYLAYSNNFLGIKTILDSFLLYFGIFQAAISLIFQTGRALISEYYGTVLGSISTTRQSFAGVFGVAFGFFRDGIALSFTTVFDGIILYFQNIWLLMQTTRTLFAELFQIGFTTFWTGIKTSFTATREAMKKSFLSVMDFLALFFTGEGRAKIATGFTAMLSDVAGITKGVVNGVISGFEWMVNGAIALVNQLIDAINQVNVASGLTGSIGRLSNVTFPRFAQGGLVDAGVMRDYAKQFAGGGMVTGPSGIDRVPAMLTAGELVLNRAQQQNLAGQLGSGGGQTVYITFQPQIYGSKDGLAEELMDSFMRQFKQHTTFESF